MSHVATRTPEALMISAFEAKGLPEPERLKRVAEALCAGCPPNSPLSSAPGVSHPPLERACWIGSLAAALYLIQNGARAPGSRALLAWAGCGGEPAGSLLLLELLLSNGADLNELSEDGETPLLVALGSRLPRKAIWLVQRGANAAAADPDGYGGLHFCAQLGLSEPVEPLILAGAPLEALCPEGFSPLRMAARFDRAEVAAALLKAGASPRAPGPDGQSAWDLSRSRSEATRAVFQADFERRELEAAASGSGERSGKEGSGKTRL